MLKVPQKQLKGGRPGLNDGFCIRFQPYWPNHVRSYDIVQGRTEDGRVFRMMTVTDEYIRECLTIQVARRLRPGDVLYYLTDLLC